MDADGLTPPRLRGQRAICRVGLAIWVLLALYVLMLSVGWALTQAFNRLQPSLEPGGTTRVVFAVLNMAVALAPFALGALVWWRRRRLAPVATAVMVTSIAALVWCGIGAQGL